MSINQPNLATATVGANGQYANIQAAIDATHNSLILVGSITEPSDIVVPANGLYINLNGYTLTMAANQFTFAGAYRCEIVGDYTANSEIDYTATASASELFNAGATAGAILILRGLTVQNNSSAASCYVAERDTQQHISNVRLEMPNNQLQSGFNCRIASSTFDDIHFVGGGNLCDGCLNLFAGKANNLYCSGTFRAGAWHFEVGTKAVLSNFVTDSTVALYLYYNSAVANLLAASNSISLWMGASWLGAAKVLNASLGAGNIEADQRGACSLANVTTTGTLILTDSLSVENQFINCEFGAGAITIAGDRHQFANCHFTGNITISSGAVMNSFSGCNIEGTVVVSGDNSTFVGCKVGADAGGGANTITVGGGVNNTIIMDSRTDAAISDSGTGTVLDGNVVY